MHSLHHLLRFHPAALDFVLFVVDIHELSGSCIIVCLHLLQVSALAEQGLTYSAALVFEDLFAFNVSTLSSLHEFVSVVLVTRLQMQKCCSHSFDFLFAFLVLGVQLITVALQLFLFLGRFNHVVDLRVLANGFGLASG